MIVVVGKRQQIGWFGEDVWDAGSDVIDFVGDVGSSIVTNLGDALPFIGGALKTIAPMLAFYPGIGTAFAVALSAAGDLALGTPLDDLVLGAASSAMPPGVPRLAFDAGADVAQAALNGENVKEACLRSGRSLAQSVGGDRAGQAFDAAVQMARGKRFDDATTNAAIAHYRTTMVVPQGTEAIAAFDAGVVIARGGDAEDAATIALRDYVDASGGKVALLAIDSGIALARGKTLQEAGIGALRNFVRGNSAQERALRFAEKLTKANSLGEAIDVFLSDELAGEVARVGGPMLSSKLESAIQRLQLNPDLLEMGSDAFALLSWVPEPIARAAQAIMSGGERNEDVRRKVAPTLAETLLREGTTAGPSAIQKARAAAPGVRLAAMAGPSLLQSLGVHQAAPAVVAASVVVPELVAAPVVASKPKTSVAGDIALGGLVAAAGVALFFWSRGK